MKRKLRNRIVHFALCAAAALIAACASAPSLEGGITGSGNKPDCEALKKKEGKTPLPEECRRRADAPAYR
jgi:hypothetical protein